MLDNNRCVFFRRGKLNLEETLRAKGRENCLISEITVVELRFGAENSADPAKPHRVVDAFVGGLTVVSIYSAIRRYAREKVRLREMGQPMNDEFDLLIGVTAIENGLILVTDNTRDFQRLDGIELENWFQRA